MDLFSDPQAWLALGTLLALEIVLGVDNVVFIAILAAKLPADQQKRARTLGLALALITRILLLLSLAWMIRLTSPLFSVFGHAFSGRDLILIVGGLFLIAKSTHEMHGRLEGEDGESPSKVYPSFWSVIVQILLLDIVFSLDSVITAVGMVDRIEIMITAVILALVVMLVASGTIASFVDRHPTVKMLALAFLLLIGTTLIVEGFGQHIQKGYIYFAMAFSLFVEVLNLRAKKVSTPIHLRRQYKSDSGGGRPPKPVYRSNAPASGGRGRSTEFPI